MLRIDNVSKSYGNGVQALKDVSLEIPKGMFGLLGPNGAGKSTLMRTLATLQEVDAGSIFFGDVDVLDAKHAVRKVLGYLPQDVGIYPGISAEALLDHFAVLKGLVSAGERREVVERHPADDEPLRRAAAQARHLLGRYAQALSLACRLEGATLKQPRRSFVARAPRDARLRYDPALPARVLDSSGGP